MSNLQGYLNSLRDKGFTPGKILDVGANVGEFARMCKSTWNTSKVMMVEATKECEADLQSVGEDYIITVLSSEDGKEIKFYKTSENLKGTGNSYYLEKTSHYADDKLVEEVMISQTIDTVFPEYDFDLLKIDTQGSEIDIMMGAKSSIHKSKYVLLEVQIGEYNIGAPSKEDVIQYMSSIGFDKYDEVENHYWPVDGGLFTRGQIFQQDLCFYK